MLKRIFPSIWTVPFYVWPTQAISADNGALQFLALAFVLFSPAGLVLTFFFLFVFIIICRGAGKTVGFLSVLLFIASVFLVKKAIAA